MLKLWNRTQPSHTDDSIALSRLLEHDAHGLIVAECNNEVVGSVIATFDGWRGNLYRLVVRSEFRRQGIGTALIHAGENHLADLGARRLTALVFRSDAATNAWRSAGYEADPRVERHAKDLE